MQKVNRRAPTVFHHWVLLIIQVNQLPGQSPLDETPLAYRRQHPFTYYTQENNKRRHRRRRQQKELTDYEHGSSRSFLLTAPAACRRGSFKHLLSASTDRIDSRMSSASSGDIRAAIQLGWNRRSPKRAITAGAWGSVGTDYLSMNLHGSYHLP